MLKELFYIVLRNPPSILLSLLPAPQQACLSLSEADAMRLIYGEDAPLSDSLEKERVDSDDEEEEEDSDDEQSEEEEFFEVESDGSSDEGSEED